MAILKTPNFCKFLLLVGGCAASQQYCLGTESFSEPVEATKLVGYVNKEGRFVIPRRFGEGLPFSSGLAAVNVAESSDGKFRPGDANYGYIDHSGALVISPQFGSAREFSVRGAFVLTHGYPQLIQLIGKRGQSLYSFEIGQLGTYLGKMQAFANHAGRWGVLSEGKALISASYDNAIPLSDDFFAVKVGGHPERLPGLTVFEGGKWCIIDRSERRITEPKFAEVRRFTNNAFFVREKAAWNIVRSDGAVLNDCEFTDVIEPLAKNSASDEISEVSSVALAIRDGRVCGVKDNGLIAFQSSAQEALPFSEHLARASTKIGGAR